MRFLPSHPNRPTAESVDDRSDLRLIDRPQSVPWENGAHFFGIAARLMRLVLVGFARERHAAKRGGDASPVTLREADIFSRAATRRTWL